MVQSKRPASVLDTDAALINGQNWKKRKQERAHNARFIQAEGSKGASSIGLSKVATLSASVPSKGAGAAAQTAVSEPAALPSSLEVQAIVSSRAFQIQSFLRSIKSAKQATTTRAWQLLPRHARRRAASHNLLRLPTRLRGKAQAELKSSTTQARTRSEIRKRLPDHGVMRATLRRQKLAHRASHPERRWLETHMWHAKRFRMTTEKGKGKEGDQGIEFGRWGFVLAETTMMKSHKASWRSALEHVTVHDASYHSVFRLGVRSPKADISSPDSHFTELRSELLSLLKKANMAPVGPLIPASIPQMMFDTVLRGEAQDGQDTGRDTAPVCAALAPVRIILLPHVQYVRQSDGVDVNESMCYEAIVFVHPAGQLYVRRALKRAGFVFTDELKNVSWQPVQTHAYAYQLSSAPNPWLAAGGKDRTVSKLEKSRRRQAFAAGTTKASKVESRSASKVHDPTQVTDLNDGVELRRSQGYNIFDIFGPKAPTLLRAILKLDEASNTHEAQTAFRNILQNDVGASELSMVSLEVQDPRLSYPPRFKQVSTRTSETASDQSAVASRLLSTGGHPPKFSKGEIDSRRAKADIPGARLESDSRDDIVPVVLIKQPLVTKPVVNAFTLIVPRGWGTAFFMSLIATHQSGASDGARVIGQHQLRHQKIELSALAASQRICLNTHAFLLSYPFNWPGTLAYAQAEKKAAVARQELWAKRPKGKRTEYWWPSPKFHVELQSKKQAQDTHAILANDRVGVARPFPFGGSEIYEWVANNSQRLFASTSASITSRNPWLVAGHEASAIVASEVSLTASVVASALVPLRLQAVRKGTVTPQSSLMLAPSSAEHLCWIEHLDSMHHPALVANRSASVKMDKKHLKDLVDRRLEIMQLGKGVPSTAPGALETQLLTRNHSSKADIWTQYLENASDPELVHNSSADWGHTIGQVLDGDYSLGNGHGFGIGVITLRAWQELLHRQKQIDAQRKSDVNGRRARNPISTTNLLLTREPGTDVLRAVTASFIPL